MPNLKRTYQDGRDEMNLADFPISILQRQQPSDAAGRKLDSIVYESSRLDAKTRQRVTQRVTLTTQAQDGLPTPADEHVILALLWVAKHSTNFVDPVVHYCPSQLFDIMHWAPNGRSYERLRGVLRRLKSLNIRYENAWWDAAGRSYEEELATGVISAYKIARQVSGPKKAGATPLSWVTWTPQFHESLKNGNIKRLNLELFFALRTPTAQRMYRFLDKRFYNTPRLSMDLIEFACGHVGLTESDNVAILKRRLLPAILELEEVGFLAKAPLSERFQKVQAGVWRVHFQAVQQAPAEKIAEPSEPAVCGLPPDAPPPAPPEFTEAAHDLVRCFYKLWTDSVVAQPGPRDLEQAQALLRTQTAEPLQALLPLLVQVLRKEWPECRSFSGAVQKYWADALKAAAAQQGRQQRKEQEQERQRREQEAFAREKAEEQQFRAAWEPPWLALTEDEREALRAAVVAKHPVLRGSRHLLEEQCLRALAQRTEEAAKNAAQASAFFA